MNIIKRLAAVLFAFSLLAIAGCASTPTQNGPGGYVDDAVITTKVKAAIVKEPNLKATEINVETFKGTVQLSGFVNTREAVERAGAVASGVEGVKAVKNDIHVK
ncbi:BON domain-containing protein [Oxalobacteraceae bacterium CAVE-383]|nr:BON domain-containing protein [Oxalobacteraceae bacterium CAVE-383]